MGIGTSVSFERDGKPAEAFDSPGAENIIELNGMKSELRICTPKEASGQGKRINTGPFAFMWRAFPPHGHLGLQIRKCSLKGSISEICCAATRKRRTFPGDSLPGARDYWISSLRRGFARAASSNTFSTFAP